MSHATAAPELLSHIDMQDNAAAEEFQAAYKAGYDAGVANARETGYGQGYRAGFAEGYKLAGGTAPAASSVTAPQEHAGKRLLGLPCPNCSCCFYSDLPRCPRCKAPKADPPAEQVDANPQDISKLD